MKIEVTIGMANFQTHFCVETTVREPRRIVLPDGNALDTQWRIFSACGTTLRSALEKLTSTMRDSGEPFDGERYADVAITSKIMFS